MKKHASLLVLLAALSLSACGANRTESSPVESSSQQTSTTKQDFSGLSFEDDSVTYDGEEHTITVDGLPEGARATYTGAGPFTNVGTYEISVTVSKEGFNDWEETATLTITKATMTGVVFNDAMVKKDGQSHTIVASGYPAGSTVEYEDEGPFTDVGVYTIKVKVTNPNYNDFEKTAVLTIYGESEAPQVIDDFESSSSAQLAENWTPYKWGTSDWTSTSATVEVAEGGFNSAKAMKVHAWKNNLQFKFARTYEPGLTEYESISVDLKALTDYQGMEVKLQLSLDELPLPAALAAYRTGNYITYTLTSDMSTNWMHYDIPLNDAGWRLNDGTLPITISQALTMGGYTAADIPMFVNTISLLVKGDDVVTNTEYDFLVDNLAWGKAQTKVAEVGSKLKAGDVFTGFAADGETVISAEVGEENAVTLKTLNLQTNVPYEGTLSYAGDKAVMTFANGALVLKFNLKNDGAKLMFDECTAIEDAIAIKTLLGEIDMERVQVVDNFEQYTETGVGYDSTHAESARTGLRAAYFADYYKGTSGNNTPSPVSPTDWSLMGSTDYLNLSTNGGRNGSKAGDFKGSGNQMRYMTYGLMKGTGASVGQGKYISFWAKSDAATTLKAKAYYAKKVDVNNQGAEGADTVALGAGLQVTTEWKRFEMELNPAKAVYGIDLIPAKVGCRILIDDIEIFGEASPYAEYVEPLPPIPPTPTTYDAVDGKYFYSDGASAFDLRLSSNVTAATLGMFGGEAMSFTASQNDGVLTIRDSASTGVALTVEFTVDEDLNLTVSNASGSMADNYAALANKKFTAYEPINLDFNNLTYGDLNYEATGWKNEMYTTDWVKGGTMRVRGSGNQMYLNMDHGYGMTYRYTYTPSKVTGPVNRLKFDWSNHYTGGVDVQLKVFVKTPAGQQIYLVGGDGSNFETMPFALNANPQWTTKEVPMPAVGVVSSITFVVQSSLTGDNHNYFYIDNLSLDLVLPQ